MTDEPILQIERDGAVAVLTLNRPHAMNALSLALRRAIAAAFRTLADDAMVGVVVLTGRGRAFCAGLDLKELGGEAGGGSSDALLGEDDCIAAIRAYPLPIIGAVNGFAITGGFELALACDVLVASTEARFADTHGRVGIVPGWGLSQLLPRRIGSSRARELSFTGNFLDAETAASWGLVNRVVSPGELLPTCLGLARDMLTCDRATLRGIKRVYDEGGATTLAEGLRIEARTSVEHAKRVAPEQIAARRRGIQERGREQSR
jgi:enoyl-CoA hydratase/carnithine racemase